MLENIIMYPTGYFITGSFPRFFINKKGFNAFVDTVDCDIIS